MATLEAQSNGPLYSNTVVGTLAVNGWAVTKGAWAGWGPAQSPHCCTQLTYQRSVYQLHII